jgi:predicted permease
VIGKTIRLGPRSATVIGVLEPSVPYPADTEIIANVVTSPHHLGATMVTNRSHRMTDLFGRLAPGVSLDAARAELTTVHAAIVREHPEAYSSRANVQLRIAQLRDQIAAPARPILLVLLAAAAVVFVIACSNVANLILARSVRREGELAVRAALGAARLRLLRHSLTESIVIALIGGVISLGIALVAVRFISNRLFTDLPGASVQLDYKVFGFALLASLVTGVLFGTVPAWFASRADLNLALRDNARGSTAGRSQHRLRHTLIVGEVAFAMVLLAAAGLFLGGLYRFINADPGWRVAGLVIAHMSLRGEKYAEDKPRVAFLNELENRLRAVPGVEHVAIGGSNPVFGFNSSSSFLVEGRPEPPPDKYLEIFFEPVNGGYFETLGARLLQGRTFNSADTSDHPNVVIINETTARTFWPNESPIGKRISGTGPQREYYQIVGVVNDLAFPGSLGEPYTRYQAFVPVTQSAPQYLTMVLRTSTNPEALGNTMRNAIAAVDPNLPVYRIRTARAAVNSGLGSISLLGSLLGAFAAVGVLLSAIGIYGVVSYTVVQRTGELGIRLALGAQARDVMWLVLGKGAVLVLIGAVLGVAGAYGVSRLLSSVIPSLPARDPFTLVIAGIALVVVALLACYIPARRATKVDPLVALRSE